MIPRERYLNRIIPFIDQPFVKILTGVRRSGKSTIMKLLMEHLKERGVPSRQILGFRLDSMEYADLSEKDLYLLLKKSLPSKSRAYLFLDEVQEISGWEKVVNSLQTDFDVDIYVTGSNSKMMSSEIETYLTGRYVSFRIFTLSFSEYLTFKQTHSPLDDRYTEFARYIRLGGFPATHLTPYREEEVYTIVCDIYQSTVFSDIVKRNQITKVDQLERIVRFAFDNVGKTFSAKSISDYLKSQNRRIDNETVYSYLEKLKKAYLLHRCSRYDVKGKEILKTQEKFYLADPALKYSILGYHSTSVAAMLENIVYLELLRRGYQVFVCKIQDAEIDFLAEKDGKRLYLQVARVITTQQTEEREYERLMRIDDNYPKYVLTADPLRVGDDKGIKTMHIADFLLSSD